MATSLTGVDYEFALLCDDVRREDNGKFILIGVYANNILMAEFPGRLRLRVVTRIVPKLPEFDVNMRIRFNGATALIIKGRVTSSNLSPETTYSPEFSVEFGGPGQLEIDVNDVDFELADAEHVTWTSLLSIPVEQLPISSIGS